MNSIYENIEKIKTNKAYRFMECILRIIDLDINSINKQDISNNVNIFRRKLGNELLQNNLYKILPPKVRARKNTIYTKLINNEICDENTFKYISYYLNLNIIILDNIYYRYVNDYDPEINNIVILQKDNIHFIPVILNIENNIINIFDNTIVDIMKNKYKLNKKLVFNNKDVITEEEIKQVNRLKNLKSNELCDLCEVYNLKYKDINNKILKKNILFEKLKMELIN